MAWMLPLSFAVIWLIVSCRNAYDLWVAYRQQTTTSLTLFIGGIFGALAVIALPYPDTAYWFWLPMVLDVDCLPALWKIWRAK